MQSNSNYSRGIPAGYESDEIDDENSFDFGCGIFVQKIKIVDDKITIKAGLNDTNFDAVLDEPTDLWFQNFQKNFNRYKRNPLTEQQLKVTLFDNENPLLLALKLFAISPGCNNLKNKSLALFVLELICDMADKKPDLTENCDDNTRMVAFNFIKLCGINSIYKAVIKAYGLKMIRPHLLPKLKEMLQQGHYKDVASWAIFLEMTQHFGIFDLLFPLMLQDKVSLAEEYLDIAPHLQLPLVQFLDSLIDKKKSVYECCEDILNKQRYLNVRHSLLLYKPMCKLITRLAKKYKIPEKHTPNLMFSKSCGYVRYLFYKYREGGMNLDAWRELIPDVATSKDIQLELLKTLITNDELDEASHWLQTFQLPTELVVQQAELQPLMAHLKQKQRNETTTAAGARETAMPLTSDLEASDDFLKLSLKQHQIILVDDLETFSEMLNFLKNQTIVAFDSEWKPSVSCDNAISLLQLATAERVYLVDCLAQSLSAEQWRQFGREIFNNLEILKIGFAIEHDLHMLQKSLPLQLSLQGGRPCFLDIRQLWRRLKFMDIMRLPFAASADAGEGLSALTEACFGRKLDKSNQCSNWANRPLRPDQIIYAALDAHCLIQIYQLFEQYLQQVNLEIDKVVEELTTGKTGYLFRMKTTVMPSGDCVPSSSSTNSSNTFAATLMQTSTSSISDIGFICESELCDLSRELRKLGIHCMLIRQMNFSVYAAELEKENRFLLTKNPQRHNAVLKKFGRDKCLKVIAGSAAEQAVFVLSHFKIQINERHFYTRCLECNGNEFILAYKDEIIKMRETEENAVNSKFGKVKRNENYNQFERNFLLLNTNEHILTTRTTYRGKPIRLQRIKNFHLHKTEQFFICDSCGFVIWYGAYPINSYVASAIGCDPLSFPAV